MHEISGFAVGLLVDLALKFTLLFHQCFVNCSTNCDIEPESGVCEILLAPASVGSVGQQQNFIGEFPPMHLFAYSLASLWHV